MIPTRGSDPWTPIEGWQATGAARYTPLMADDNYQATMPAVAAGRAAVVARLRMLASRLDELSLDTAAEVLVLIEPALERQATLAMERAPVAQ